MYDRYRGWNTSVIHVWLKTTEKDYFKCSLLLYKEEKLSNLVIRVFGKMFDYSFLIMKSLDINGWKTRNAVYIYIYIYIEKEGKEKRENIFVKWFMIYIYIYIYVINNESKNIFFLSLVLFFYFSLFLSLSLSLSIYIYIYIRTYK